MLSHVDHTHSDSSPFRVWNSNTEIYGSIDVLAAELRRTGASSSPMSSSWKPAFSALRFLQEKWSFPVCKPSRSHHASETQKSNFQGIKPKSPTNPIKHSHSSYMKSLHPVLGTKPMQDWKAHQLSIFITQSFQFCSSDKLNANRSQSLRTNCAVIHSILWLFRHYHVKSIYSKWYFN